MVLKITKETWEKCGITTVKYYNKKEDIIELWQKMNDVKRETGHLDISDTALRRIKKYCSKKIKDITEKKYKLIFQIIIFSLKKILCLIKNLITENQIFGLKVIILLLKLMKEIMKIMIQMMKKKEKTCLKNIILKFFDLISMILSLIFLNF